MVFREDLEGGTLGTAAIDAKVGEYRAKLIAEAETEEATAAAAAAAAAAEKKSSHKERCARHGFASFFLGCGGGGVSVPWSCASRSS